MVQDELSYLDYVKAAFHQKARLPLLGHLPANYLGLASFAVLGLANPGFLFLGLAAELTYLVSLAGSERYRRLVRGERLQEAKESYHQRVARGLQNLPADARDRYRQLWNQCQEIVDLNLTEGDLESLRATRTSSLNQLLWIFLRLLHSQQLLSDNLSRVDREGLEAEVARVEERLEGTEPESALARSLRGTLEIQKKRLENLTRSEESLQVIEAELARIEQQVELIREEAAVSRKPEILSDRLDTVATALTETNRWMDQNAEIFAHLGADPLGAAPDELPELPRVMEIEG